MARHQLQHVAVHTYDAQAAVRSPQPLPEEIALDGVEEFVTTCVATTAAWPHTPAVLDYHASEGRSWRLRFSEAGAQTARLSPADQGAEAPDAAAYGTASELVLFCYGRLGMDSMRLEGDRRVFQQLIDWEPEV